MLERERVRAQQQMKQMLFCGPHLERKEVYLEGELSSRPKFKSFSVGSTRLVEQRGPTQAAIDFASQM